MSNAILRFLLIALAGFIPSAVAWLAGVHLPTPIYGLIVAALAAIEQYIKGGMHSSSAAN